MNTSANVSGKGFVIVAISLSLLIPIPASAQQNSDAALKPIPETGSKKLYRGIGGKRRLSYSSRNAASKPTSTKKPTSPRTNPFAKLKDVFSGKKNDKSDSEKAKSAKSSMIAGMSPARVSVPLQAPPASPSLTSNSPTTSLAVKQVSVRSTKTTSTRHVVTTSDKKSQPKSATKTQQSSEPVAPPRYFPRKSQIAKTTPAKKSPWGKFKSWVSGSNNKPANDQSSIAQTTAKPKNAKPIVVKQTIRPSKSAGQSVAKTGSEPRRLQVDTSNPVVVKPVSVPKIEAPAPELDDTPKVAETKLDPAFAGSFASTKTVVKETVTKSVTTTKSSVDAVADAVTDASDKAAEATPFKFPVVEVPVEKPEPKKPEAIELDKTEIVAEEKPETNANDYLRPIPAKSDSDSAPATKYTATIAATDDSKNFEMPVEDINAKQPKKEILLTAYQVKMQKIAAVTNRTGMKGFCPVVLRDDRELAEAKPEFQWGYNGRTYEFSSAEAREKFKAAPYFYAPAVRGSDIVMIVENELEQQGQLDYATWFQGRLYLFTSVENLKKFRANPKAYAGK